MHRLLAAWPGEEDFPLIVVDNSRDLELEPHPGLKVLRPDRNLGFAGGINLALQHSSAPIVMLLNPDVRPLPGAVGELADALDRHRDWPGLAPRLSGDDGSPQYAWQLRPLPTAWGLLRQLFFLPGVPLLRHEPKEGVVVQQPAAAALAIRRSLLESLGGLDTRFHPAWFEDVDLGARLVSAGHPIRYWPRSHFVHELGSSVASLGYGPFLWAYYRNLTRYLRKHHGAGWAAAAHAMLPAAALARIALLPFRQPRRAASRAQACAALLTLAAGAVTGFRRPRAVREVLR